MSLYDTTAIKKIATTASKIKDFIMTIVIADGLLNLGDYNNT